MRVEPFTLAELAERLGHVPRWLTRDDEKNLQALYAAGMPRPLSPIGHRKWDRARMEAWLRRGMSLPTRAANDEFACEAITVGEERSQLALVYGGRA